MKHSFTKIVATLGPASSSKEVIRSLAQEGVSVFRLNFSHGSHDDHRRNVGFIREVEKEIGRPIGILCDLQGPKLRIGTFKNDDIVLAEGDKFRLDMNPEAGDETRVCLPHPEIFKAMVKGMDLLVNDGIIRLKVDAFGPDFADTTVVTGGRLSNKKGVNVPGVPLPINSLTEKDRNDLEAALGMGVDYIGLSFVQNPEDVLIAKYLIQNRAAIISKIEKPSALEHLEEIIRLSDGVMIARGDLGVEVDMEEVPVLQKQFIHKCNVAAKPVITATQMLDSMIRNPRPTRAEASDVANAIIDGTDAIMLSGETAAGKYPIEAVGTMVRIATYIEAHQLHDNTQLLQQEAVRNATVRTVANAVSYSCCQMARDLNANAIITPSNSGTTARMVARFRPDCPIIAPTPSEHAYNQLGLSYGVVPAHMGVSGDTDELINTAVEAAQQSGLVKTGDVVIISAGVPTGVSGTTNLIKAHIVGNVLLRGEGVGSGCASGNVCTVNTLSDLESDFKDGNVIVTKMTTSEMLPYMRRASAVVVESTNPECHAAVACQAMGIPMMMDRSYQAVHMLKSGMMITVDANEGFIYNGIKA